MIVSWRGISALLVMLIVSSACASVHAQAPPKRTLIEKRVKDLGPLPLKKVRYYRTALSPTGERLAYRLKNKDQWYVVCDGKPAPTYGYSGWYPVFSPDGRRLVYGACREAPRGGARRRRKDFRSFLICDGKELGRRYDRCHFNCERVFSPDSKRLAYIAEKTIDRKQSSFVVCDGQEVYRGLDGSACQPVFSPDSLHLAFYGQLTYRDKYTAVCNGKALPSWEGTNYGSDSPVFSPDSRHLVYGAKRKGRWFVVQAELRGDEWGVPRKQPKVPTYERCPGSFVFSPDGRHLAYRVGSGVMVLDGKPVGTAARIYFPKFSLDSQRLAYRASGGRKACIVVDGKPGTAHDWVCWQFHVFSPDSKRVAYIAWRGGTWDSAGGYSNRGAKWFVVCDGRERPKYDYVGIRGSPQSPVFSPDSKHLAWFATRGDKQFIVIDGIEGPKHAFVRIPRKPHVQAAAKAVAGRANPPVPDRFRYVVGDGKEAWLVEVDWPNGFKPIEHPREE